MKKRRPTCACGHGAASHTSIGVCNVYPCLCMKYSHGLDVYHRREEVKS